jgi:hypothetical protein
MSSKYQRPSNKVTAGELILPKNEYLLKVGAPTIFSRIREEDNAEIYGARYPMTVVSDGEFKGRSIRSLEMYAHTDGAVRMTKRFVMASLGYDPNSQSSEVEFNVEFPDFTVDPEEQTLSECFNRCAGCVVVATVDVKENARRPGEMQNSFGWMPQKK